MNIYSPDSPSHNHNPPAEVAYIRHLEQDKSQAAIKSNPLDIVTEKTRKRITENDKKNKNTPPAMPSNAGSGASPAITTNRNDFHFNGENFVVKTIENPERPKNYAIGTGQNENSPEGNQKLNLEARELRAEALELARQIRDCYGELSEISAAELSTEKRKDDHRTIKEKKHVLQEKIGQFAARLEILKQHSPVIRAFIEGKIRTFLQRVERNASVEYQLLQKRKKQLTEFLKSRDIHGKAVREAMAELAEIDRKLGSSEVKSEHRKNRRMKGINVLRMRKELSAFKKTVRETRRHLAPYTWFETERKKVVGKKQDRLAKKLAMVEMAKKEETARRDTVRQKKMPNSKGNNESPKKVVEKILDSTKIGPKIDKKVMTEKKALEAKFAEDWNIENEEGDNQLYARMDDEKYQDEISQMERGKLEERYYEEEIASKQNDPYELIYRYYKNLQKKYAPLAKEREIQRLDQLITDPRPDSIEGISNKEERIGEVLKRKSQDIKNAKRLERLEESRSEFAEKIQRTLESKRNPRHRWKIS